MNAFTIGRLSELTGAAPAETLFGSMSEKG